MSRPVLMGAAMVAGLLLLVLGVLFAVAATRVRCR